MSTSGTVGQTVIDVDTLIGHAMRRCGVATGDITVEHGQLARNNLYFYLSNLANHGVNLWTISRDVFGVVKNSALITLPLGTIGVLNANYRTLDRVDGSGGAFASSGTAANAFDADIATACINTAANGYIGSNLGTATSVTSVGIMVYGAQTLTPVIEYSDDAGTTWATLYTPPGDQGSTTITLADSAWAWWDIPYPGDHTDYRIRETGGATMALRELYFGNTPSETPMARLNRDDYSSLPNKSFTGPRSLQFWFDRKRLQPEMYLWPLPANSFDQIVVFRHRQIQDVGSLTNEVEIPQRWIDAIVANLALRMGYELPGIPLDKMNMLQQVADRATYEAEQEERDASPIFLYPAISVYTR
jgi:hypothetical protein